MLGSVPLRPGPHFEDRRERQRQGIDLAKGAGRYVGRKPNTKMHERVIALKSGECSIAETARLAGLSVSQVKRVWVKHLGRLPERGLIEQRS